MPHVSHMGVFGCVAYTKVPDQNGTKLDANVKCLFFRDCERMKKIIKSPDVVFLDDKTHLEDCPSGRVDETPAVKLDIFPKSMAEDLNMSGNVSEPNEEYGIKEDPRLIYRPQNPLVAGMHRNLMPKKYWQPNHLHHRNMTIKTWAILDTRISHTNR